MTTKDEQIEQLQSQLQDLEGKYKLLKKKLKREKDENAALLSKLDSRQTSKEQSFVTEVADSKDKRIEVLEDKLDELERNLQLSRDDARFANQNFQLAEDQARQEVKQQMNEIRRLKEDLKKARQDKADFELICQNLNDKIRQYVNREELLEKQVKKKEDMLVKHRNEIEEQDMVIHTQATDLKKSQLKLRQI